MTTLSRLQEDIAEELKLLNEDIAATLHSPNPLMNEVVDNYLRTKGKQIRPILVILSAKLFGKVNPETISAATSVELLHNASLIHDDVVDETKLRRNKPTINGIWDNHIAVLVGDFFVSSSLQKALETGDVRIISAIAQLGKLLSIGEIDQIYNAQNHTLSEDAYFEIIFRKTASLFMACVEMGAYAVKANEEETAAIREFARLLGLCFQIKDDIFDYYDDETIGKPTGNDLREGKITLPLLHVLADETAPAHEEMLKLSQKEVLTTEEIHILTDYAKENGGIEYAYETMSRFRNEAMAVLDTLPEKYDTEAFRSLIDFVISRKE
ncbi:MAG: polyprenyl synthetase family protein [Muribaculaceae bacterium]